MDQHRYYRMSAEALDAVQGRAPGGWGRLLDLHASHPPLYSWLGALAMGLTGERYDAARRINVPLALLLVGLVFLLARPLTGDRGALVAAAMTGLAPLTMSFAHVYYIESLLAPLVVATFLLVMRQETWSSRTSLAVLGLIMGLGCLAKWTYPMFVAAPIAFEVLRRRAWKGALLAAAVAGVVAGPWYLRHLDGIHEFFGRGVTGGEGYISAHSGLAGLVFYPRELILVALGIPFALAALAGIVLALRRRSPWLWPLLLGVVVPIIVFTLVLTKKPRHLLPVIPLLGIFAAVAINAIPRPRLRAVVGTLLLLHVTLASLQTSFRILGPDPVIAIGRRQLPILSQPSPIPGPPDAARWPYADIVTTLDVAGARGRDGQVLILFNTTPFREVGFRYWAEETGLGLQVGVTPFSFEPRHPAHAPFPMSRSDDETPGLLDARFLLAKTGVMWVRYANGLQLHFYGARIGESLMDPDSPLREAFHPIGEWPLPDGSIATAFEANTRPGRLDAIQRFARRWTDPNPVVPATSRSPQDLAQALQDDEASWRRAAAAGDPTALRVLDLWEASRTDRNRPHAALHLARLFLDLGAPRPALRWLRRALEGNRHLAQDVATALIESGHPKPPPETPLLDHLRTLDAR
jgi:hypothetical protein